MMLSAPEQLWASDITYIRTQDGFSYLSMITDAYSRKIVGFALHPNLDATGCIIALEMAITGGKKTHRSYWFIIRIWDTILF